MGQELKIEDSHSQNSLSFDDNIHALELLRLQNPSKMKILVRAGFEREFYYADLTLQFDQNVPTPIIGKLQISNVFAPGKKIRDKPALFSEQILLDPYTTVLKCKTVVDYPSITDAPGVQAVCYIISEGYYGLKVLVSVDEKSGDSMAIDKVFTSMPQAQPKYIDFDETRMVLTSWSYTTYFV